MTVSRSNRPATRRLGLFITLIAVAALTACEASPSPAESTAPSEAAESAAPSAAESTAASPSEAAPAGDTTVTISGSSFGGDITITAGSTVTFVNNDGFGHSVTNGENGAAAADALFDESLGDGDSFEFTFDTPGTYLVTCTIHPSMNMTITVV